MAARTPGSSIPTSPARRGTPTPCPRREPDPRGAPPTRPPTPEEERIVLLSRVAENAYWAGRYLERAESTARLVKTHTELFLDL
ncbi:MAG: alpha-E domain-containing protein, partial [Rhodocyclaceae bacterium]|nr:alpha-E domain-containing protein [Rhodocyclaceae bacterium]